MAGKTLFPGVSVRVFQEEVWFSRLSEEEGPHRRVWASSHPLGARIEKQAKEGCVPSPSS